MNSTAAVRGSRKTKKVRNQFLADIGQTYRDRKKKSVDPFLLFTILALVVVGVLSLASASHSYAYHHFDGDSGHFFVRQLAFACAGIVVMLGVSLIPVKYYSKNTVLVLSYLFVAVLLVAVYFFPERNGVHRWIAIGGFSFQPSELAKFVVIMVGAYWGSELYPKKTRFRDIKNRPRPRKKYKGTDKIAYEVMSWIYSAASTVHRSLFFYLGLVGIYAALIVFESHLSCTIIILGIAAVLIIISGCPKIPVFVLAGLAGVAIYVIIFSGWIPYSSTRIDVWLHPEENPQGAGWQTLQSLYAIGNGGFLGQGISNSTQKHLYVSEPHNDFIFAVICEELGFVGALMIIGLFLLFVYRAFVVSVYNPDRFSKLLGIGIAMQVGIQSLLNMAVVTNTIPNTGISLPFFSYGGTSLLVLLAEMGVLLAISRQSSIPSKHKTI